MPVDPEILKQLLVYNPETGKLFWRKRSVEFFEDGKQSAEHAMKRWNARYAGKESFTYIGGDGYKYGGVFGGRYPAHRVAFAVYHGAWPDDQIDHVNGVRDDKMTCT